ncbi:MAG: hypothetical protein RLZZ305_1317 [Actinomycetota bacterium]
MNKAPPDLGLPGIAVRKSLRLDPDPSRIAIKLFVAGQEDFGPLQSRTNAVIARLMQLTDREVTEALSAVKRDFEDRHEDFDHWLDTHAHRALHRVDPAMPLSEERWKLIGACFTHEFAVEGAALTNPSVVPHPDQSGLREGTMRFLMTVRCIGEGHRSCIGFRTGTVDTWGDVVVDEPTSRVSTGIIGESMMSKPGFMGLLEDSFDYGENARTVLAGLRERFTLSELEEQLNVLLHDRDTYRNVDETLHHFRDIAARSYLVTFPSGMSQSERILWPRAEAEFRGMEDARVTMLDDDGTIAYVGTYTAFDGVNISQQGMRTDDFANFSIFPITGPAARGKGLAIFPRRIGGVYASLVRPDYESNQISFSEDIEYWSEAVTLQAPSRPWEIIQLGNCGSPLETEAGWLVITHAVGPFRTYYLSAMLLDREDPERVIGSLGTPLLSPAHADRDGYVPNVVYSCGSLIHHGRLVLPFGIADRSVGFATARVDDLLERLTSNSA